MNFAHQTRRSSWLRAAATLGALTLASVPALAQSPTGTSPNTPTPFSWPQFHSGGADTENSTFPDYGQLQGTPTGLFTIPTPNTGYPFPSGTQVWTQYPSFLLGTYSTTSPRNFIPNTFNTRNIAFWYAPFAYANALSAIIAYAAASNTTTWTAGGATAWGPANDPANPTTPFYLTGNTVGAPASGTTTGTWTLSLSATQAGNYSIVAHIPVVSAANSGGMTTDARYTIHYANEPNGVDVVVSKSQAAGGSITLLSPVFLTASQNVTVTIDNYSAAVAAGGGSKNIFAGSMSLQSASGATLTVDENNIHNSAPTEVFTPTPIGAWNQVSGTTGVPATASNNEYLRALVTAAPSTATAQWEFVPSQTGLYNLSFHIPNSDNSDISTPGKEYRVTDAHYVVKVGGVTVADVRKSQTDSNGDEALAGPFSVTAGQPVDVILSNDTSTASAGLAGQTYVVADTMSLTDTNAATVDGTPVAVNATDFPDIVNAKYQGVLAGSLATIDPVLRGGTDPATPPDHLIRQLVYFGRTESSVVNGSIKSTGYVYCVDGLTGGVVWRYTLPAIDTANSAVTTNTAIHSTPAVARFNVLTNTKSFDDAAILTTPGVTADKLCVVVCDDGGRVFCLDAVGNADGQTIDPTAVFDPYNPATKHIGTTKAYWIFRPDQNLVQQINANTGAVTPGNAGVDKFDPTRHMFAPLAFNNASPTIAKDTSDNATIYIGNSNGVLYALDATGVPAYGLLGGNTIDVSPYLGSVRLLDPDLTTPGKTVRDYTYTCNPLWWFSVSGTAAGAGAQIESAPSVQYTNNARTARMIYFGSSHELGGTSNYGRVYALPDTGPTPVGTNSSTPATKGYNTSTSKWQFPNALEDSSHTTRPALGDISGSPVVFTGPTTSGTAAGTSIYFAANMGSEVPLGTTLTSATIPTRDTTGNYGRIWCIDTNGVKRWAYPDATDPNSATLAVEPTIPIGGFKHATPAMGIVEYPGPGKVTYSGGGIYSHPDAVHPDISGNRIPMLYVGTFGDIDSAMYAIDVEGQNDTERGIYRLASPNGSVFQSSPALITNANLTTPAGYDGFGGMVYCTAGDLLYQFSATPISNPSTTETHALIGVDAIFGNCGPVSSPSLAAADVTSLSSSIILGPVNTTDWLYVGDTTTGLVKGLTPAKQSGGFDIGGILPGQGPQPGNPDVPALVNPNYTLHAHVLPSTANTSRDIAGSEYAINGNLPVFEWGDDVTVRITNIVPANPGDQTATLRVKDPENPSLYYFTNGSPVTLQIGDVGSTTVANDNGLIPAIAEIPGPLTLPSDGMYFRSDASVIDPLTDGTHQWFGAYNYAIRDGSGRLNTPGSTRRITLARQTAEVRDATTNAILGTVTLQTQLSGDTPDPTFGILNPLALTGQANSLKDPSVLVTLGSLGPNTYQGNTAALNIEALANGNTIYSDPAQLPKNGYSFGGSDPTNPGAGRNNAATFPTKYVEVATATGEINHGSSGDNTNTASTGYKSLLTIFDRSFTPKRGGAVSVRMEASPLRWNDPSTINGFAATINPLPWESSPVSYGAGANHSVDYPDIPQRGITDTLTHSTSKVSSDLTHQSGVITDTTQYAPEPIIVNVKAPKYQPANLTKSLLAIPPVADGYHTRVTIFVDTNQNGVRDAGEAYRDVDLQSGVLVDMSTSIAEATTDVGIVPQGFGIQTDPYGALGNFVPPGLPFNVAAPYQGNFGKYFKTLSVFNNGNTNLVNAQFDQRISKIDPTGTTYHTINLGSDSLDASAGIPGFDMTGVTGARPAGLSPYLVRTSLDRDLLSRTESVAVAGNPLYPGNTFHKPRVGDSSGSLLTVPDKSPDDGVTVTSPPMVSVAVPLGTPAGTYHQTLRLFEGMDYNYDWLSGPTYGSITDSTHKTGRAGHTAPQQALDIANSFSLINTTTAGAVKYESVQPYSEPGTVVKVTATEARLTSDKIFGDLPMIDDNGAFTFGPANYSPSAYRDFWWAGGTPSGTGNVDLAWTSTRSKLASGTGPTAGIYTATLPYLGSAFMPSAAGASWWSQSAILPGGPATGINVGYSVAMEPHVYVGNSFTSSGERYGFYSNINGAQTDLLCVPYNAGGVPQQPVDITQNDHTSAKYGVKGLKVSKTLAGGSPFLSPTDSNAPISYDLWAFWYSGARGGSSIQYNCVTTNNRSVSANNWTNPATLPVPAGLVAVSEPHPVLLPGTPGNTRAPSYIQVTYTGIAPDGNSDIYVSRYQPFHPYAADPADPTKTLADPNRIALALIPTGMSEYLQPDANNLWWQARDVAWVRAPAPTGPVTVSVGGFALIQDPLGKVSYDRASGLTVYTAMSVQGANNSIVQSNVTMYVDTARGRIRFRPALIPQKDATGVTRTPAVLATFSSQASRITVDTRADTSPVAILDEAYKANEAPQGQRVSTGRMWYFWRKSGGAGGNTTPTLYYKTQRLTVQLRDLNGRPISLALDTSGNPIVKLYHVKTPAGPDSDNQVFYDTTSYGPVDVDWKRGRLYFPRVISKTSSGYDGLLWDAQSFFVDYTYYDSASRSNVTVIGNSIATPFRASPQWMDEELATDPVNVDSSTSLSGANTTGEHIVPMHTPVNESNLTAFLNPTAYANVYGGVIPAGGGAPVNSTPDQAHDIWMFWTSNRNGVGDLYWTTLNPKFSVDAP
ncbi:hypothetical protein [Capsulimonas corticalis]|nr:hypothetical protein [Capsulimonas corticalis]